tara:strand:- start:2798 stop:3379 length:582 start_codon:yes stop_codon:yes gene_type:complete
MMKKFIIILGIIIVSFHSLLFAQNQKVLLMGECDGTGVENMLNYLDQSAKISLSIEKNIVISEKNISVYPIILICNNGYLKLTNDEVILLKNHLKQGGLLILDNITSDYTFSIFLKKILPEFSTKILSLEQFFSPNILNIDLAKIDINLEGLFINNRLALLGIKKSSLIKKWIEEDEEFLKVGSSIIFYDLTE